MSLHMPVLRLFLSFTHFQNLPKVLSGHVVQLGVIVIQAMLTLPTRDGPGGQELPKPDSLLQCAGWMEKPIHTGNFWRRKGRDQSCLVFPKKTTWKTHGDTAHVIPVTSVLWTAAQREAVERVQKAAAHLTSHLCKVSSRDSLRLGSRATFARSWAWKGFYLPTGDLLEHFHHTQSLVED